MGKMRRHRIRHIAKPNPLGILTNINDEMDREELEESSRPVECVRLQLQNSNVEEKLNGLQSLAILTTCKDKVAAICRTDVVRIAAPLLCEKELPVRNATAGALRNLSTCGPDLCDFLVEQDVMTPLLTLLHEYAQDTQWAPTFDTAMMNQMDLRSDIFLQAINLLWNLCESSSIALDTFNQSQLLNGLIRCLDYKVFGLDISISLAQCLLVISENNPKCWTVLNDHIAALHFLLNVTGDHSHVYLRTLAAGILANVPALSAAHTNAILNALTQTLQENHLCVFAQLPSAAQNNQQLEVEIKMDTLDEETEEAASLRRRQQELPTEADLAVRDVGYLLDAQRVASEVVTNLCSIGEDEWQDMDDMDDVSDSDSIIDMDHGKNGSNSGSCTSLCKGDKLSVEIVEIIKSMSLAENLWAKAQPLSIEITQMLRESNFSLLMKTKNLRISCLLCLQNLCNVLSVEELGGPNALYNVWVELCQQVFKEPQDGTVLEPLTSLMRAALERLKTHPELFQKMTKSDLEVIINGIKKTGVTTVPELRANWLRMLGTLGCLLSEEFVKMIITYMVWSCEHEDDLWTISEVLDALMDIFAEQDWTEIVVTLQLPQVVKELQKIFKTKLRQQRKELKERYTAVRTVQENLSRFVKHLENEALKCGNGNAPRNETK